MTQHIQVTPTDRVSFAESNKTLSEQIATRQRSIDFFGLGMYLPNPDPVLKALGKHITVYRELRSDAHVGGCIRRRKAAVKALEHGIDVGKARSKHAQVIEDMLADLDLMQIVTEALDAVLYGYQPMEVMWQKVGSLIVPVSVVGKPANWFVYDENNQLRMLTREAPVTGIELPEKKFLVPRQDATYDNPYGFADLSMCFWPTTFKKGGLKFWVQFSEKYGSPWVIGKHPRGADDKEADALLDRLDEMVQDAVAVIPDDASIEIMEAGAKAASADVYERLLRFCRSEVSIALLGQNQTTESDANRASAEAGLEVTSSIRDGDRAIVTDVINTLIRWTCELNWGDVDRPLFEMWEQESVDKTLAERDETLTRAGARLSKAYFQRAYQLEESDLKEDLPDHFEDNLDMVDSRQMPGQRAFAESEHRNERDALDELVEAESENWQPVLDPLLAPIEAALSEAAASGETAAEFLARLPALLEQMDAGPLTESLTRAAFTARLAGEARLPLEGNGHGA
jgi:phage gp29-like protein